MDELEKPTPIRLSKTQKKKLVKIARKWQDETGDQSIGVSTIVRKAIDEYLERNGLAPHQFAQEN